MAVEKIVIQQQQANGSYNELWPKNDSWSKVEVLSDLTKELLGLGSSAIPDDAFVTLTVGKDSKAYRVKVTYPNGQPAVGFTVGGLTAFPALGLTTNSDGIVMGSSTSTTPTITVTQKYDDVLPYSGSFTSTRMITDCNVVLSWNETPIKKNTRVFSPNLSNFITNCACLIVGGGGGRRRSTGNLFEDEDASAGGGGGAGGQCVEKIIPLLPGGEISVQIGAGGNKQSQGGVSSITIYSQTISASGRLPGGSNGTREGKWGRGASGGQGNGNGGQGGDFYISSSTYNGKDGSLGEQKNFYGQVIKTGGGGGRGGAEILNGGWINSDCGTSAESDAGRGGIGEFAIKGTQNFDTSGLSGGCWIVYLHS